MIKGFAGCTLWLSLTMQMGASAWGQSLAFSLPDTSGQEVRIEAGTGLTAVCFLGTECPLAKNYAHRLNELQAEFADRLQVIGVMSNRQDSPEDIRRYCEQLQVAFPLLKDEDNVVADRFGATRTPEVFLLDQDLKLRYHGRIDDQYAPGVIKPAATREDLRVAIEQLLAGKPVSVRQTLALGCIIGKVPEGTPASPSTGITFYEDVVDVLQRNCIDCHRSGEIGPFTMDSYDEIVGWADTMLETIEDGRMPPWHADPQVGSFLNERVMPESDTQVLRDWIAGGLPPGTADSAPPPAEFTPAWQLPQEPELVVAMRDRPFVVARDGVIEYQYFVVDPQFEEDKWITAAEVQPGSSDVVHHAIVFVRPPDGDRFQGIGWLSAYVPGQRVFPLPPGHARRVPAGSKLVFQMHYTPVGREREDITRIGLLFTAQEDVTHEVYTRMAINQDFEIPPGAADYQARGSIEDFAPGSQLLGITPHMHYRGASFRVESVENGHAEPILNVPRYDFNWQHTYQLREPLPLGNDLRLQFEATFDNSTANPFNPDPSKVVSWGDQTWEEMAVVFFEVAAPRHLLQRQAAERATDPIGRADVERLREQYTDLVLRQLDKNRDGVVLKSETDTIVRHRVFGQWDIDGDEVITRQEVRQIADSLFD